MPNKNKKRRTRKPVDRTGWYTLKAPIKLEGGQEFREGDRVFITVDNSIHTMKDGEKFEAQIVSIQRASKQIALPDRRAVDGFMRKHFKKLN